MLPRLLLAPFTTFTHSFRNIRDQIRSSVGLLLSPRATALRLAYGGKERRYVAYFKRFKASSAKDTSQTERRDGLLNSSRDLKIRARDGRIIEDSTYWRDLRGACLSIRGWSGRANSMAVQLDDLWSWDLSSLAGRGQCPYPTYTFDQTKRSLRPTTPPKGECHMKSFHVPRGTLARRTKS